MKKTYIYSGYIETSFDAIIKVMKTFLKPSKIRDRYASGIEREVKYKDDDLDIYVYRYSDKGNLFQVELNGTIDEAENFIRTLTAELKAESIAHRFEWSEVDENDNQIGEEFEIKFPN